MPIAEALNENNEIVLAWDASLKKIYLCPICRCKLRALPTSTGRVFYYPLAEDEGHTNEICKSIATSRKSYSLNMISRKSFFDGVDKTPKSALPREKWDQTKLDLKSEKNASVCEEVCYKATSLSSVIRGKLYELGPDYPVWGHRLIESFCFFRFFEQFFQEKLPVTGEGRVFEAAFLACNDDEQMLVFTAFSKDTHERALFYCRVVDFEVYLTLRERFVERVEESGITINRPRHVLHAALILGYWTDISDECTNNRCALFSDPKACNKTVLCERCHGKFKTLIHNANQIFYTFVKK